jgi:NADH-quinone oxidoreductase subunit J
MMYIFAIQLVSKRTLQGLEEHVKGSRVLVGALAALIGFGTVMIVFFKNQLFDFMATMTEGTEVPMEQIGQAMVGADKYGWVLPFEFISIFLLACIIGGIMIARKEDKQ